LPTHNQLFRPQTDGYEELALVRSGIYSFEPSETSSSLPDDATPVDCVERIDGWYVLSTPRAPEETVTFTTDWIDYVYNLPSWERMLLHQIDFKHQTPLDLFESLSHGQDIVLVSDGAADHLQGAAGWVLAIGSTRVCTGQLAVPGFDPRSYRAEGYDMIGGLLFLHHLSLYCNRLNTIPLKTIYCDMKALLKRL
jgi:hypothetical protein